LEIPISLSGGFAECRPNHFHTGIDIKTAQKENMRVLAAADGYISRISISHSGYGNCLYVTHPNGYTTVYGHLNDFFPTLQKYMLEEQYRQEKWNVELYLKPEQFPVKKGQFIAYSGTTGGSTGPHLHFEIRNSKTENVLNEFLFGLPIKDTKPPVAKSLAVYDGDKSIYMQDPILIPTLADGKNFKIKQDVLLSKFPSLFIGLQAQDYMDNSTNWLGIFTMKLFMDDQLQLETKMQELDFAQNRYMNAYADFKTKEQTGIWYQGLYRLPNNRLNVYTFENDKRGILNIADQNTHQIKIEISDPFGNVSNIRFSVKYDGSPSKEPNCAGELWKYNQDQQLETKTLRFSSGKNAFYDDICMQVEETPSSKYWSNIVQVNNSAIPIHEPCTLSLKLNHPVPFDLRSKLIFVHHIKAASLPGNNPQDGMAVLYDKSWVRGIIRTFGNYFVDVDTIPPTIRPLQKGTDFTNSKFIKFKVEDDKTSVAEFSATLNGKWLRFVRSGNNYTYIFDEKCLSGTNKLEIIAVDESQNQQTYSLQFNR